MFLKDLIEKKLSITLFLCSTLAWTGCTVKSADNEIAIPDQEQKGNMPLSIADEEFEYNYTALSFYYLAASTQLLDADNYIGKGELAGFSPDNYEYPDIYYMYSQMDDNYTLYFGPYYAQQRDFSGATESTYDLSVSIESTDSSKLVITQVFRNGPGEKAGLKEGDTVLYVGTSIPGDAEGFNRLTTGKDGDSLSLKILRGSDTLDIKAQLFCYKKPSVFLSYRDSIPVIKITEYASASAISCAEADDNTSENGTADEFKAILKATKGAAVIDLRGNPGGTLDQCFSATEALLSKGDTLVIFEYADVAPDSVHQMIVHENIVASEDGTGKGRYYVFLADTNTASCAEIMIMGATTNLKTPVVGTITYGKSIGQYYIPTIANGYSIITGMKIYDKTESSPHDYGILPDYEIADTLKALDKAVELAKAGKEKRTKGYGTKRLHHFTDTFAKKASNRNTFPKGGAYKWKKLPSKLK